MEPIERKAGSESKTVEEDIPGLLETGRQHSLETPAVE